MTPQPTSLVAHQSEADRRAKAEASKKAQLHSARMNGIKEGRGLANKELITKLGTTLVEQGLWPAQKHELEHQWALRERKHGWMRLWQGAIAGMAAGAFLTIAVGAALMRIGTESTVSGVAVGSQIQRQSENVRALDAYTRGDPVDGSRMEPGE